MPDDIDEGDEGDEGDETFTVDLSNLDVNLVATAPQTTTVTITDNDTAAVLLSTNTVDVTEGGAGTNYTIRLQSAPTSDVVVNLTPDAEVTVSEASLTFTPANWDMPQPVTVSAINDDQVNASDPRTANIAHDASGDARYAALAAIDIDVAITDNDSTIRFAAAQLTLDEGGTGITITVERVGSGIGSVVVDYATADGTAIAGEDYTATSGQLTWGDGDRADKTITVQPFAIDDDVNEDDDAFIPGGGGGGLGGATLAGLMAAYALRRRLRLAA